MRSTRLARRATAVAAALLGALAAVVVPTVSAQAADACTTRTTAQAFAAFGDTNNYFAIGGGTFESGDLSSFGLTGGPSVVAENEPWHVLGPRMLDRSRCRRAPPSPRPSACRSARTPCASSPSPPMSPGGR